MWTGRPDGAPPWAVLLEGRDRRGAEGGRVGATLSRQRVDAVGDGDTIGHGTLARLGEGDGGIATEADDAAAAAATVTRPAPHRTPGTATGSFAPAATSAGTGRELEALPSRRHPPSLTISFS